LIKLNGEVMPGQSENISLNGMLVTTEFFVPEGSEVELAIAVPNVLLAGRGKVIRARLNSSRNFSVAIALERPLLLMDQHASSDYTFWQRHFSSTNPILGLTH
jgi:PilZ domain